MRLHRLFCVLLLASTTALADIEIPECYKGPELGPVRKSADVSVVVLLDDTTMFDKVQQAAIQKHIAKFIRTGWELRILRFSANIQGRYTTPVLAAAFAFPLEEGQRNHIRKPTAQVFDQCREIQLIRGKKRLSEIFEDYFSTATNTIARSEILAAVRDVGASVLPSLKGKKHTIFLVSDMLENSSTTSFYQSNTIRMISPEAETTKAEKAGLMAKLGGASVYVFGAGVIPQSNVSANYLDQERMGALRSFWKQFFDRSGGRLEEFGQPLLLKSVVE